MLQTTLTEGDFVDLTPEGERACPKRKRIGRVTRISSHIAHLQVDGLYYHPSFWRLATFDDFHRAVERHEDQGRSLKDAESEWCLSLYEALLLGLQSSAGGEE